MAAAMAWAGVTACLSPLPTSLMGQANRRLQYLGWCHQPLRTVARADNSKTFVTFCASRENTCEVLSCWTLENQSFQILQSSSSRKSKETMEGAGIVGTGQGTCSGSLDCNSMSAAKGSSTREGPHIINYHPSEHVQSFCA